MSASATDARPALPPLLGDDEKHALGIMAGWPFRRTPANSAAVCWLCGRPASYLCADDDDPRPMHWCARHAVDF